ncbi:hypothetical protein DFH28DRAFT_930989 [Melampsora americana]|nr:hypothetical protein DFH28DRAFT_930989 [Melampsora americana]
MIVILYLLPRLSNRSVSLSRNSYLNKNIINSQGHIIEPNLIALLIVLRALESVSGSQPIQITLEDPNAPRLNESDYQSIRDHHSGLLSALPEVSLEIFIEYTLKSRNDSFTICLINDLLNLSSSKTIFTIPQRKLGLKKLINMSRRRRRWVPKLEQALSFVSDESVSMYFNELVNLTPIEERDSSIDWIGLSSENLRCVMKALRRSNHSLFWNIDLMEHLWMKMIESRSNDNRMETHARLGIRSILKWISSPNHSSSQNSLRSSIKFDISQHTLSLCLKIYSQLVEWNYVQSEDVYRTSLEDKTLEPHHQAIMTILGSMINTSIRRYSLKPLERDNVKLFKDSFEALEVLWNQIGVHGSISYQLEQFSIRLIQTFNKLAKVNSRSPAPLVSNLLLKFSDLPIVRDRRTEDYTLTSDDLLYKHTLETFFDLGRSSLLVETWLKLVPRSNLAKLDWSLLKLINSLEELSNPLIRGERGKPLSPFRLVKLILLMMESLSNETDKRMRPSRKKAFRVIMEHPQTQTFDWLRIPLREFDKDGIEIKNKEEEEEENVKKREEENLKSILKLWKSSWGINRNEEIEKPIVPLPLSLLKSITKLYEILPNQNTNDMLKEAITIFITHRTLPIIQTKKEEKYLKLKNTILTNEERSQLISSHLVIKSELSQKFCFELFEEILLEKHVLSSNDLNALIELIYQVFGKSFGNEIWKVKMNEIGFRSAGVWRHEKRFYVEIIDDYFEQKVTLEQFDLNLTSLSHKPGKSGKLPWKLKKDMKYFKFITSFIPSSSSNQNQNQNQTQNQDEESLKNVVMMGRKTWESIPKKFKPLENRINIIISKNQTYESLELSRESKTIYLTNSIQDACKLIKTLNVYKTFLIGGSELYNQIIQNPMMKDYYELKTILMTRILNDEGFECDRFLNEFRENVDWKRSDQERFLNWIKDDEKIDLEDELGFKIFEINQDGDHHQHQIEFQLWER